MEYKADILILLKRVVLQTDFAPWVFNAQGDFFS